MAHSKADAITAELEKQILSGKYRKGEKLPTENELLSAFGVSRQTIRKALAELSRAGLINSIQGSGSFVSFDTHERSRTHQITVITSYIGAHIFPFVLRGIEDVLSKGGYTVNVRATNNSVINERRILSDIIEHPVDGIAIEGTKTTLPNPNLDLYSRIAEMGIPIVMFNNFYPGLEEKSYPRVKTNRDRLHPDLNIGAHGNVRHVVVDDYAGGYALTDMLIAKGHRTIGAIFKSDDMQGVIRYSGYLDCMLYHNADFRDSNVVWYTTETSGILKYYLEEHLRDPAFSDELFRDCTAIICYNDRPARLVLSVMERPGFSHPLKAVYSFDRNWALDNNSGIETYSLGYPKETMGTLVGEKLLALMDGMAVDSEMLAWEK